MKKLILTLMAVVLAASVVLSTGVAAAPPWSGNGDHAPRGRGQLRPPPAAMRLGMMVAALTPELAERLEVDYQEGLVVVRVVPGGQAAEAGLERGDIITAVNGSPVANPGDLKGIIKDIIKEAEGVVTLTVVGKGDITLDLSQAFPSREPRQPSNPQLRHLAAAMRLGMMVAALTPELAERLEVNYQEGLVVVRVAPEGQAAEAGLERGDIITAVNGSPVASPGDLKGIVKEAGGTVTLTVVGKGDITLDLSQAFPSGERRPYPMPRPRPKPRPGFWLLRLLGSELEGIPAGERYSHFMGLTLRVTDNDGVPHTLELIPGTVAAVSGDSLALLTNEGSEVTYTITEDVKGHQLMERLEEGRKLIVATVDGSVRAIFPPRLLLGHPHRPPIRPLAGVEGTAED
jgi:membrane-associated protease RseP (regulator of RpoE activity)